MPSGRKPKPVDEQAIRNAFKSGTGVKPLALMYGIGVKRCREIVGFKPLAKREVVTEPVGVQSETDETLDAWDITINVPASRIDQLLSLATQNELLAGVLSLSDECKATAFQTVMQTRMNEITNQEAVSDGPTEAE